MNLKRLGILLLCGVGLLGCSDSATAPKLAPRQQRVPVEACYQTDLDLRKLKASSVRNLATCLNGTEGAIQPYVDFLEKSVTDDDLKVLLDIYNKHLVKESRFRKVFDFIDHMNKQKKSDDFYKNITYLTQTRSLQTLLPVLAVIYQAEESGSRPIDAINEYLRVFIEKEEINRAMISLANLMGSGRSRWATYMGASFFTNYPNTVDKVVDDVSDGIYQAIQTNGWQEFLLLLTDPIVHPVILRMLQEDKGVAKYGMFMKELFRKQNQTTSFQSLVDLSRAANAPIPCWEDAALSQNLFGTIFDKLSNISQQDDFEQELLQRIPAVYFLGRNACSFSQTIRKNIQTPTLLARDGYSYAMYSTVKNFSDANRSEYIEKLLTSVNIQSVGSALENMTHSDVIFYVLEVLQKDLTMNDFISFHRMIRNMFIEDIQKFELEKWVNQSGLSFETKAHLLNVLQQNRLSLHALLDYLMHDQNTAESHTSYSELILYLSQREMVGAPGARLQTMMMKLFGPNYVFRRNLKDFARTYIESLSREDAGWGDLLASFGEAIVQTGEAPFVDFLKDLITDREFVVAMNPILEKFFKDPLFLRSLAFTGELSNNGELRRLISFFIQVAKSIDVPGLEIYPSPYSFTKYRGPLNAFQRDFSYQVQSRQDYSSCWNLTTRTGSELWMDFIQCTNAAGSYPSAVALFTKIQNVPYKQETLYSAFTRKLDEILSQSSTYGFVLALRDSSSILKSMHQVLSDLFTKHQVFSDIDKILSSIALDLKFKESLVKLGELLKLPNLATVMADYLEVYEQKPSSYFNFPQNYISTINNPNILYQKVYSWRNDLDYSELPNGPTGVENLWIHASKNFAERNWAYYYQSGVYAKPPGVETVERDYYQNVILEFLKYSQRTGDLEALVDAFKTLEREKFPFVEMFHWMVEEQDVVKYYTSNKTKSTIRLVTPADKLEILVQNAQIGVAAWAGSLGADHIATFFQYEIATSTNMTETLKKLKSKISSGLSYTSFTGDRKKNNHLRNIEQTFSVLEQMHAKGYLRFLQVIYAKLLNATPEQYKKKQDPILNHMGLAHHLSQVGLLIRTVHSLEVLVEQQKLSEFTVSFEKMIRMISTADIPKLRSNLDLLLANDAVAFKTIFHSYWEHSNYTNSHLFRRLIFNSVNLIPESGSLLGLLNTAPTLLANTSSLKFISDAMFDIAGNEASIVSNSLSALNYIESTAARDVLVTAVAFSAKPLIENLNYLFVIANQSQPQAVESFYQSWVTAIHDSDIDFRQLRVSLLDLSTREVTEPRILPFLGDIISNNETADVFSHLMYSVAREQQSEALVNEYLKFMITGEFESVLEYLEAFKPSNSRVSNF